MQVLIHAVHLGTSKKVYKDAQGKESVKMEGTFHQPKSEDNSPIRIVLPEDAKLEQYKPYSLECDLREWSMRDKQGNQRNGITLKASKVLLDK